MNFDSNVQIVLQCWEGVTDSDDKGWWCVGAQLGV